ncbi:MAG: SDR family NAD(P)-dependent oxidoreductase [Halieaceae bacterium]|jgi:short-subunit dehydrogenase|nr:SDR family NAD(P)-dependent oxidoreductase [Halieaceae bacterium]
MTHKTTALVTGASAGIGAEFCRQLADRCEVIIATGRRLDRLQSLAQELEGLAEVHTVAADLATREGCTRVIETLRQKGPADYLVNNAGFSTLGPFDSLDIDHQQAMVDVHITATLALTRAALPFMRELKGGAIINVSSLASFGPVPMAAVYAASKGFLNIFSESLQKEVADAGIRVQSLCPGYTFSEFHDRDAMSAFDRQMVPEEEWMDAPAVVAASLAALEDGPVVLVPGEGNRESARKGVSRALSKLA